MEPDTTNEVVGDKDYEPGSWLWYLPLVALMLYAVSGAAYAALWIWNHDQAVAILAALAAFLYGGKLAAIPVGIAAGGAPLLIAGTILVADLAAFFLFYPFTQFGVDRWMIRSKRLESWLTRLRGRARRSRLVARHGALGLFLLALIPFSLNTPMLDAFIGRVAGLRTRQILTPVLAEMTLMNLVWLFVFGYGLGPLGPSGRKTGLYVTLGVLTTVLIVNVGLRLIRRARKARDATKPI